MKLLIASFSNKVLNKFKINDVCEGIDYVLPNVKLAMRTALVCSGTLSLAFITGWFSATEISLRVSSYILFSWFGILSLMIFFIIFAVEGKPNKNRYFNLSRGVFTIFMAFFVFLILTQMSYGALSLMRLATTQPFRKDLNALDYDHALKDAAQNAGYPLSALIPFYDHPPMFVDVKYLSYSMNTDNMCNTPGRPSSVEMNGEIIDGSILPLEGTQLVLMNNSSSDVKHINIFGIRSEFADEKQRNAAASTLLKVAKRITKNGNMEGRCFKPSKNIEKWACSINHILHDQEIDIATILLQNGWAKIDLEALKGSAFEKLYIDAQISAVIRGCGIWEK